MKTREPHDVPLSRQAIAVLKAVWPLNEEHELEGGLENGPALVLVKPDEKSTKFFFIGDGGAVLHLYFQKRAAKGTE